MVIIPFQNMETPKQNYAHARLWQFIQIVLLKFRWHKTKLEFSTIQYQVLQYNGSVGDGSTVKRSASVSTRRSIRDGRLPGALFFESFFLVSGLFFSDLSTWLLLFWQHSRRISEPLRSGTCLLRSVVEESSEPVAGKLLSGGIVRGWVDVRYTKRMKANRKVCHSMCIRSHVVDVRGCRGRNRFVQVSMWTQR